MSISSRVADFLIGLLEDERVQKWVDTRITNALNTQKTEILTALDNSTGGILNKIEGSTVKVTDNIGTITQSITQMSTSLATQVISGIKSIVPFHLLKRIDDE